MIMIYYLGEDKECRFSGSYDGGHTTDKNADAHGGVYTGVRRLALETTAIVP